MKHAARMVFGFLLMAVGGSVALADCKECSGAYCTSVRDLERGWDDCRITTSREIKICGSPLKPEVCITWTTNCEPIGDNCTNYHYAIRVTADASGLCEYYSYLNNSGAPCPFWR